MSNKNRSTATMAQRIITTGFLVKLEELLVTVQYVSTVCKLLGLSRRTFYVWKKAGHAFHLEVPEELWSTRAKLLVKFYLTVERAQAKAELNDLKIIDKAAAEDWRAAAWRLTHRAPQRWSEKRRLTPPPRSDFANQVQQETVALIEELRGDFTFTGNQESIASYERALAAAKQTEPSDFSDDELDYLMEHEDSFA